MIYDAISNIAKYKDISYYFKYAAGFLETADLSALPDGRTSICGEHVFVNVMDADTKEEQEVSFEVHKKYWDVQIDIEGTEQIQIGLNRQKVVQEFDPAIDFGTFACDQYLSCVMGPGRFIVCMDNEPHRPTLRLYDKRVRKCVIKVEV